MLKEIGLLGVTGVAAPQPSFEMNILLDTLDKSPGAGLFFFQAYLEKRKKEDLAGWSIFDE